MVQEKGLNFGVPIGSFSAELSVTMGQYMIWALISRILEVVKVGYEARGRGWGAEPHEENFPKELSISLFANPTSSSQQLIVHQVVAGETRTSEADDGNTVWCPNGLLK